MEIRSVSYLLNKLFLYVSLYVILIQYTINSIFIVWFGVIFVRQGFYVDAVFRFTILLPDKFPDDKTLPVRNPHIRI